MAGIGEGLVDGVLERSVDLAQLVGGEAQQQVAHAVGVVPAPYAPLAVQAATGGLAVAVGPGPCGGGPLAELTERLFASRAQQLVFAVGGDPGGVGDLVGLVVGDVAAAEGVVGAGLVAETLGRRQPAPGARRVGAGLAADVVFGGPGAVAPPCPGLLITGSHAGDRTPGELLAGHHGVEHHRHVLQADGVGVEPAADISHGVDHGEHFGGGGELRTQGR